MLLKTFSVPSDMPSYFLDCRLFDHFILMHMLGVSGRCLDMAGEANRGFPGIPSNLIIPLF